MFWGSKKESTIASLGGEAEFSRLAEHDVAVLFKHSPTCIISSMANSQVEKFHDSNPAVPIFMVSVRKERPLSNMIAESTGIEHASPQIIVFRKGTPTAVATHGEITVQRLNSMLES
jgi:bacillithiol system protein YtxJ